MGYYINQTSTGQELPATGKVGGLLNDGAEIVQARFQPNLICVVDNGVFQAVGFCFNKKEFQAFNDPHDTRSKTWMVHPKAAELSGYKK